MDMSRQLKKVKQFVNMSPSKFNGEMKAVMCSLLFSLPSVLHNKRKTKRQGILRKKIREGMHEFIIKRHMDKSLNRQTVKREAETDIKSGQKKNEKE